MSNSFTATLKSLRQAGACFDGYNKLVRALQGLPFSEADADRENYIRYARKAQIPIRFILESNGLDDALWSLRCVEGRDREIRLFAVWCARQVQHMMTDPRSVAALDVAERFAQGLATAEELDAAQAAALDALAAASDALAAASDARAAALAAARAAARAAAWAARDAAWAASDAAWAAAWAARAAARAASDAASDAARDAARTAASDAARDAQKAQLIKMLEA